MKLRDAGLLFALEESMASPFRIGINMAGAVSAGAYTAGALDFLMEALEEWQKAKEEFRKQLSAGAEVAAQAVPLHEVRIDVFTGASAGGMCAAISSVMVGQEFKHIRTGDEQGTSNVFYESWVNKISIEKLLQTRDVENAAPAEPLYSLLDSSILDDIADYALNPKTPVIRPYIAKNLTLFLTLTNIRGIPYKLYSDATSVEEHTTYYADRLRFETVAREQDVPQGANAKPLPAGKPGTGAWPLLKEAAKATGAVPVALAARTISREAEDYKTPGWEGLCRDAQPLPPAFPEGLGRSFLTVNVDGGVTDNSPFALAHDILAQGQADPGLCKNPPEPDRANAAVITVAPFPMEDQFTTDYDPNAHRSIWSVLMSFFTVTLSQSRFLGESLQVLMEGSSFSRFVVAPSDADHPGIPALQCASLGAFGGFFCRDFRKHDFLLGRRNCQQFLRTRFALPVQNQIIAEGLAEAEGLADNMKEQFLIDTPTCSAAIPQGRIWMPLIPLCGSALREVPEPERSQIAEEDVEKIVDLIVQRLTAIRKKLVPGKLGGIVSEIIEIALHTPILAGRIKSAIKERLLAVLNKHIVAPTS